MKINYTFVLFTILLIVINFSLPSAETIAALDEKTLGEITNSLQLDALTRALMNAATNNEIKKLTVNREFIQTHNEVFNVKINVKGITDQKSSGRCWMFAGLNIMRPIIIEKFNLDSFEFSQTYLFLWDKLEKSNFFLEAIIETRQKGIDDRELEILIKSPLGDGGWWNYYVNLIEKYGIVPQEIMPETVNSSQTKMMNEILESLLRQEAASIREMAKKGKKVPELRAHKVEMLKKIYQLLVIHLGLPPKEFTWRYINKDGNIKEQDYTPLTFYKEAVNLDLKNYVALFNHPVHPFDKHYQIKYCRNMFNMADMNFINLEMRKLKTYTLKSLLDNEPVWFAADTKWQMEREVGIMREGIYDYESLFGVNLTMSKSERILYRVSTPNHAMAFVAVDTVDEQPTKWRVENSWGEEKGDKGYWTMYNNWFDNYVYTVIVHKKYLTGEDIAILQTKPEVLPAWDPINEAFK
jgi:bleomycin hydrolase